MSQQSVNIVWMSCLAVIFFGVVLLISYQMFLTRRVTATSMGWSYHKYLLWTLLISTVARFLSVVLLLTSFSTNVSFIVQRYTSLLALLTFTFGKNLIVLFFGEFWTSLVGASAQGRERRRSLLRQGVGYGTLVGSLILAAVTVWSTSSMNSKKASYSIGIVAALCLAGVVLMYIVLGGRLLMTLSALPNSSGSPSSRVNMQRRVTFVVVVVTISFLARAVLVLFSHFNAHAAALFEKTAGITHFFILFGCEAVPTIVLLSMMGRAVAATSLDNNNSSSMLPDVRSGRVSTKLKDRMIWVDNFVFVQPLARAMVTTDASRFEASDSGGSGAAHSGTVPPRSTNAGAAQFSTSAGSSGLETRSTTAVASDRSGVSPSKHGRVSSFV